MVACVAGIASELARAGEGAAVGGVSGISCGQGHFFRVTANVVVIVNCSIDRLVPRPAKAIIFAPLERTSPDFLVLVL